MNELFYCITIYDRRSNTVNEKRVVFVTTSFNCIRCKTFPRLSLLGEHCFICRFSDFIVSEDAETEPRTVATLALTARRSNHSAKSHPSADLLYRIFRKPPFCLTEKPPMTVKKIQEICSPSKTNLPATNEKYQEYQDPWWKSKS